MLCKASDGEEIANPAILIDTDMGTLHAWGDEEWVTKTQTNMARKFQEAGIKNVSITALFLRNMTPEQAAYCINRCVMYTASGFQTELVKRFILPGFTEWLSQEQARVEIKC